MTEAELNERYGCETQALAYALVTSPDPAKWPYEKRRPDVDPTKHADLDSLCEAVHAWRCECGDPAAMPLPERAAKVEVEGMALVEKAR